MTCENCIHNTMCPHTYPTMLSIEGIEEKCKYFIDQRKCIITPYAVGNKYYKVDPFYGKIQEGTYHNQREIYEHLFYNYYEHSIFKTQEEAQAALDSYNSVAHVHLPPKRGM